jgi:radical SAM superfamily enzyme YgiQ (UPF0313 family)
VKINLLLPPLNLEGSYGHLASFSNPQPSIGVAYIAAVLKDAGHEVSVTDAYALQLSRSDIVEELKRRGTEVLGISCLSSSYDAIVGIARAVRETLPSVKIICGNLHASLFAEEMLKNSVADFIVHREGEYVMRDLCAALSSGGHVASVPGVSYLSNGEVQHNEESRFIENLDALPYPAWDLFPLSRYGCDPRTEMVRNQKEIQILATRGCPNACTFCSSHTGKSQGSKYRMRRPASIADEMEYMIERHGVNVVSFMDLAFPLVKKHAMSLFEEITRRGLHKKIKWGAECRVRPLDEETVRGMKEAGCIRVNFGIESGNDRILRNLKKNFTVEDVKNAVSMTVKAGIEVDGMFMIGLPTETEEEINDTINLALDIKVRYAIFNLFVPYPGCELFDSLSAEGKIHFSKWSDFTSYGGYSGSNPVYVPDTLSMERLLALQSKAMRKFYFRPRFIAGELSRFRLYKVPVYATGMFALVASVVKRFAQ